MTKHKDVHNVLDVKGDDGLWLKSYRPEPFVQHHTRASIVWNGINYRCKRGQSYGTGTYEGCSVLFEDFQVFAEWCQGEYGYRLVNPNGHYWPIDKDLIQPGTKNYSPETCMFIPQKVNSCFTLRQHHRGRYPIGVIFHKRDQVFEASCNDGTGKVLYLGRYDDPMLGHLAWVAKKIKIMESFRLDPDLKNHKKLMEALDNKIDFYSRCLRMGIEVKI